jgi:hypothetical protein
LQRCVRLEQAIQKLLLLFLRDREMTGRKQQATTREITSHASKLPKRRRGCKGN